jgi:hypothetical protein
MGHFTHYIPTLDAILIMDQPVAAFVAVYSATACVSDQLMVPPVYFSIRSSSPPSNFVPCLSMHGRISQPWRRSKSTTVSGSSFSWVALHGTIKEGNQLRLSDPPGRGRHPPPKCRMQAECARAASTQGLAIHDVEEKI